MNQNNTSSYLCLSDQQSKIQSYSIYNHIKWQLYYSMSQFTENVSAIVLIINNTFELSVFLKLYSFSVKSINWLSPAAHYTHINQTSGIHQIWGLIAVLQEPARL